MQSPPQQVSFSRFSPMQSNPSLNGSGFEHGLVLFFEQVTSHVPQLPQSDQPPSISSFGLNCLFHVFKKHY